MKFEHAQPTGSTSWSELTASTPSSAAWFLGPKTSSADFSVSVMAYTVGLPQAE